MWEDGKFDPKSTTCEEVLTRPEVKELLDKGAGDEKR